jgi:ketosteroid isomerase-like protein
MEREFMRIKGFVGVAVLIAATVVVVRAQQSTQVAAENYIKLSEQQWAEASMKRDTATVERIVADDFVGVDPSGAYFRKADELADVGKNEGDYVSAKSEDVTVRFYGNAAVAQGSESWQKRSGERGRYVWTDTWIRRNGKWQIVAAVDVKVPEPAN